MTAPTNQVARPLATDGLMTLAPLVRDTEVRQMVDTKVPIRLLLIGPRQAPLSRGGLLSGRMLGFFTRSFL
jgi:hypothetical protein